MQLAPFRATRLGKLCVVSYVLLALLFAANLELFWLCLCNVVALQSIANSVLALCICAMDFLKVTFVKM